MDRFDQFSEKGKLKIDHIRLKAAEVFSRKGYLAATLGDVAEAADISKGGIYHYFQTKEELLFLILMRYMEKTLDELKHKLDCIDHPSDRIREFIQHHINHYRDNFNESRLILLEAKHLPHEYWKPLEKKEREYVHLLSENIRDLVPEYRHRPLKIKIVTFSLIGMCNWPYTWFNPQGSVTPEELSHEIYTIFMGDLPIKR